LRDKIKNEMGRACSSQWGDSRCKQGFGGANLRKRPFGRPRRRMEDNNKMDLKELEWQGMDWIDLFQNRDRWRALVNAVMKIRVS
jgi:hypothetical protein